MLKDKLDKVEQDTKAMEKLKKKQQEDRLAKKEVVVEYKF